MTNHTKKTKHPPSFLPRVLADFGGRRKVFERRLRLMISNLMERRSGDDRRSGFDRRSTRSQHSEDLREKRINPKD